MDKYEIREVIEGSAQIAQVVVNYYFELKQCGLDDNEALQLAIGYQNTILGLNNEPT